MTVVMDTCCNYCQKCECDRYGWFVHLQLLHIILMKIHWQNSQMIVKTNVN